MEQVIFKPRKRLTTKQIKMAVDVLTAIGLDIEVENNIKTSEWIPTKEELAHIDKAKQSVQTSDAIIVNNRKELHAYLNSL
ncbi:MAG: hypothetical protein LBT29_06785 [Flavobacteriaceae bacterium]|jgi:hypothetical protein|nr:hypothetical protein [Flavobacteriaceae bacterium]